ncbi:orotidine-5'-phosphate decarboxylase [Micavibrio aeruginosavorus]|uniref:Orotidine 5'-phosphate decarboxylase n=1 Tax=Micavibrio aeruginosavorus (strain ARL-13) TaxID=856793 RepID=G2KMV2_MICAA|nr:orotidine-5'-phosphate decarboxylase [Micavibrio aeruginosavorus]AEP08489.1 orotidine 5'-phosphate decarboxylase [Micavibrio aeruginosavorus ARL-13]
MTQPIIFCAIDTPDLDHAKHLVAAIGPVTGGIKLGLEFFCTHGPDGIRRVMDEAPNAALFLDLKFHDIPNTVAAALRTATRTRPAFVNVHASGGADMMRAGHDALMDEAAKCAITPPRLLAVTILTSLDAPSLSAVGQGDDVAAQVIRLATLTKESGLDGVVCSAHEIAPLRAALGPDFTLMVPGIRPAGSDAGDQKRTMAPDEALHAGASHLVIGRPITGAADPAAAARTILATLKKPA